MLKQTWLRTRGSPNGQRRIKKNFSWSRRWGYFDRVFGKGITAEKFALSWKLASVVDEFVRQFMTRKRRADKVADWSKDYAELLGADLVNRHSDVLNQVIPQSAVFLTALVFDDQIVTKGRQVDDVIAEIRARPDILNELLVHLIDIAKNDQGASKSWPTLLKSQPFFERVATFLKGRASV